MNGLRLTSRDTDACKKFRTYKDGTGTEITEAPAVTINTWHTWEILYKTTEAHGYVDNDEVSTGSTTNLPTANMGLSFWLYSGTGEQSSPTRNSKVMSPCFL